MKNGGLFLRVITLSDWKIYNKKELFELIDDGRNTPFLLAQILNSETKVIALMLKKLVRGGSLKQNTHGTYSVIK